LSVFYRQEKGAFKRKGEGGLEFQGRIPAAFFQVLSKKVRTNGKKWKANAVIRAQTNRAAAELTYQLETLEDAGKEWRGKKLVASQQQPLKKKRDRTGVIHSIKREGKGTHLTNFRNWEMKKAGEGRGSAGVREDQRRRKPYFGILAWSASRPRRLKGGSEAEERPTRTHRETKIGGPSRRGRKKTRLPQCQRMLAAAGPRALIDTHIVVRRVAVS